MSNEITMSIYQDTLMHYGILGMHWGVRRYQPYGEGGYDPDHKGRNVGLAARLAGGGSSYSSTYGRGASRGSSPLSRNGGINVGPSNTARKISRGINEGLERLNYANDRLGQGIKNAGKKARNALNEYSGTMKTSNGKIRVQEDVDRVASYDTKTALKQAAITFKTNARMSVNNIKHTSKDDIMRMIGDGSERFKSAVSKTAVKSKEFGRNAALTAALLGGAFDPTSSASQLVNGRYQPGSRKAGGSYGKDMTRLSPINKKGHNRLQTIGEMVGSGDYGSYHLERLKVPKKAIERSEKQSHANIYGTPEKEAESFAKQGVSYETYLRDYDWRNSKSISRSDYDYMRRGYQLGDMQSVFTKGVNIGDRPLSSAGLDLSNWEGKRNALGSPLTNVASSSSTDLGRRLLGL